MATDPFQLFEIWFAEAQAGEINDPEAMALATADARGRPSVRMVLLKGHGPERLHFLHQRAQRQGRAAGRKPARLAALPLEVPAPAGPHRWRGRGRPVPRPTLIGRPARAIRSSAPGRRSNRARSIARDVRAAVRTGAAPFEEETCRGRRTGVAIAWFRRGSSSGPTGPIASTSGACSGSRVTAGPRDCSTRDHRRNRGPEFGVCKPSGARQRRARSQSC